ncbi:MAG: hypothetical protein FOGNACKC_06276 [Anaerolineae bacterium]|nr:hypothetical protein [Anaerolineae bacterium]
MTTFDTPIQLRNLGPNKMKRGVALLDKLIEQHWAGPAKTLPPGVRVKIGERTEPSGSALPLTLPATEEAQNWQGYNTGLKPAWEPVILCRAPKQGKTYVYLAQTYGTGTLNVDAGRVAIPENDPGDGQWGSSNTDCKSGFNGSNNGNYLSQQHPDGRWPANLALAHHEGCEPVGLKQVKGITGSKNGSWRRGGQYDGGYAGAGEDELGRRLGYANADGTETVAAWACAGGCGDCGAEWAAETLSDCPDCGGANVEWLCPVRLLDEQAGQLRSGANNVRRGDRDKGWSGFEDHLVGSRRVAYGDSGAASRFFYAAKVSPWEAGAGCEELYWRSDPESPTGYRLCDKAEWETLPPRKRNRGNIHPTRKPIRLIAYLARILLAPRHVKSRVCIPFFGSGSEGAGVLLAAKSLGVEVEISGIENEAEYCLIGEKRLSFWAQVDNYETARQVSRRPGKAATETKTVVQTTFLE